MRRRSLGGFFGAWQGGREMTCKWGRGRRKKIIEGNRKRKRKRGRERRKGGKEERKKEKEKGKRKGGREIRRIKEEVKLCNGKIRRWKRKIKKLKYIIGSFEIFIRTMDENEKQFYSSKCHKYPPGSLQSCMGASACGQQ